MERADTSIFCAPRSRRPPNTDRSSSQSTPHFIQRKQDAIRDELCRFQVQQTDLRENPPFQERLPQGHEARVAHNVQQPIIKRRHLRR